MNTIAPPRVKPVLRWPGGKTRLLKHILPIIPDHHCYAEAFAGGLAVLLAKPRSRVEVVNDISHDIVTLYRVVQFHAEALISEMQWVLHSRQTLADYLKQPGLTDIQHAARFLLRNRMSFAGNGISFAVSRRAGGGHPSRQNVINAVRILSERLDKVSVEHLGYERFLELYDSDRTCFFLDPPYLNANIKAYAGWSEVQMSEFADRLNQLVGFWILTVDDSEFNRSLFAQHNLHSVATLNGCVNRRLLPDRQFGELIITPRR